MVSFYEIPRAGKPIEAESRMVVVQGWGGEGGRAA
jgi:hypothetical protein